MSAIATFTKLPIQTLGSLAADYDRILETQGVEVADYGWSGWVMATVLAYLDEQEISLTEEYGELSTALSESTEATVIILTARLKELYRSRLAESSFSVDALRDYYNAFNESSEPGAGQPMLDGIKCLRESLDALDSESVVVVGIG